MRVALDFVFRGLRQSRPFLTIAVILAAAGVAVPARATPMLVAWEPMMLPVTIDGQNLRLETLLLYPNDGARHPLAIVSHGTPRSPADRAGMSPSDLAPEMLWFARRGWAVAAVMRRGHGHSDGGFAEDYGGCRNPDFYGAGMRAATDIAASIGALSRNPHVDESRILAAGVSAGAYATVALTSMAPSALRAAVVFAPGRGSKSDDQVCAEARLAGAYATYGTTSRVPVLWISAANDHYFGPRVVKETSDAFRGAGGQLVLFSAPAIGPDGHHLFEYGTGEAIWGPVVDRFLAANRLALLPAPADLGVIAIPAPKGLSQTGQTEWLRYLLSPPHKAFAASIAGAWGYSQGKFDTRVATAHALQACKGNCDVVNVDGGPP